MRTSTHPLRLLIGIITMMLSTYTMAVTYCATKPIGYGAAATGGGNATPTLVSTVSQLKTALGESGSKVIIITQDLTFTSMLSVKATNKTLMALPGVKLISTKQDQSSSGILYFSSGSSNIILRNLTFEGPGAYDCDGNDLLCFDGVTKAWVDHCDFQDGCDGNFDNKGKTDNVTVTWCRFRYLKEPKAGGSGGSDDHRYTNLLGSSSSDKPSDGTYNMTWAYCWWDNGCRERMLRCRNASLHFLNCYWNSNVANYYIGPENADCYIEGCSMQGKATQAKYFYQNYGGTNGSKWVNCIAKNGVPANVTDRTVVTPTYSYTALSANDAVTAVTNTSCGAGATLTVTTDGKVSSSCDSGKPDPEPEPKPQPSADAPDPISQSTFWNISDNDFNSLGTITDYTTVRGLKILAKSDTTIVVDSNNKSCDGISFTSRLKLVGTGSGTVRSLIFTTPGACTIDVYCISSNSGNERSLTVRKGYKGTELGTCTAPGSSLAKTTIEYTGTTATPIWIYSENSGVNIYGIRCTLKGTTTELESAECKVQSAKYLHDGKIVIERNRVRYDLKGKKL